MNHEFCHALESVLFFCLLSAVCGVFFFQVKDPTKLSRNYRKTVKFKLDILAMIPLGTMALLVGGIMLHTNSVFFVIIPLLFL